MILLGADVLVGPLLGTRVVPELALVLDIVVSLIAEAVGKLLIHELIDHLLMS